MKDNSSYPTIIIPDGLCEELSELFEKKGWTYGKDEVVTPKRIENNITRLTQHVLDNPESVCISSGRISLVRTVWGDTQSIDICVEFADMEFPYDSSPTTKKGDDE